MKHFLLLIWMTSAICEAAENAVTTELVRPILEASGKSFPDFVNATTVVEMPPLPLPKIGGTSSPIDAVSALVWKQISTVDVAVGPAQKTEKLEVMKSMGKFRAWLLKDNAYANLFFAAFIEETVSMSTLAALSEGKITVEDARQLMAALAPPIASKSLIEAMQRCVPQSTALSQIKEVEADNVALLTISNRLANELEEEIDTRPAKLTEQERPASLAFHVALASSTTRMAAMLVELAGKGGDLNLIDGKVAEEIERLMPEVVGIVDPASGMKIEAGMFRRLMHNVRKWKSRH